MKRIFNQCHINKKERLIHQEIFGKVLKRYESYILATYFANTENNCCHRPNILNDQTDLGNIKFFLACNYMLKVNKKTTGLIDCMNVVKVNNKDI